MIIVWRSPEGHVSSSKRGNESNGDPRSAEVHVADLEKRGFSILERFPDWDWASARSLIAEERLKARCPFCECVHWSDSCPTESIAIPSNLQ